MDYCAWLKNAPFVRYVGPHAPWTDNLSVFASSVTAHHPIVPVQVPKCGPDPDRDPFVYAGLPLVSLIAAKEITVGHPIAATGFFKNGLPVEARVLQTSADRFRLDFHPHMLTAWMNVENTEIESLVTLVDHSTFYVHTTLTNRDTLPHEYGPWIQGRLEKELRGRMWFDAQRRCLAADFTDAGGAPADRYLRIRPGFTIESFQLHEWPHRSPFNASNPHAAGGTDTVWWNYHPVGYELYGPATRLRPGEKLSYACAVGVSHSTQEAFARLDCGDEEPQQIEQSAREWYNQYLSAMPEPPDDLNERERKYYYGSGWVIRHNEIRATGEFTHTHWLHGKGMLGHWGDTVWTPDDAQFLLLQLKDTAPELGKGLIREICDRQGEDGSFSTMNSAAAFGSGHGPYTFAWNVLNFHETVSDESLIKEVYDPFCRFHRWMSSYWDHDGSGFVSVRMPTQAGYDNSPTIFTLKSPVVLADANAAMVVDACALARMAEIAGRADDVTQWCDRARDLSQAVTQHFLHAESGLFFNRYCGAGEYIQIKGFQCMFFPLWARLIDEDQAKDAIERYLLDEDEFFTLAPFPDIAKSEIYHNTGRHSGTTFLHWSLMGLVILAEYGYDAEADIARRRIIDFVSRSRGFWQFWCPEGGGFEFKDMGGEHRISNATWCAVYASIVRREYTQFARLTNDLLQSYRGAP